MEGFSLKNPPYEMNCGHGESSLKHRIDFHWMRPSTFSWQSSLPNNARPRLQLSGHSMENPTCFQRLTLQISREHRLRYPSSGKAHPARRLSSANGRRLPK